MCPGQKPAPEALISLSKLVLREIGATQFAELREVALGHSEEQWVAMGHERGSPWQQWYRDLATQPTDRSSNSLLLNDYHSDLSRNIAMKADADFSAENIFFRCVDTGRLLPMSLAGVRIQWYATKGFWERVDAVEREEGESKHTVILLIVVSMVSRYLYVISPKYLACDCGGRFVTIAQLLSLL